MRVYRDLPLENSNFHYHDVAGGAYPYNDTCCWYFGNSLHAHWKSHNAIPPSCLNFKNYILDKCLCIHFIHHIFVDTYIYIYTIHVSWSTDQGLWFFLWVHCGFHPYWYHTLSLQAAFGPASTRKTNNNFLMFTKKCSRISSQTITRWAPGSSYNWAFVTPITRVK